MAKKGSMETDKRRRKMVARLSRKRAELKSIAENREIPIEERFAARLKLAELPRNSSPVRIVNRCQVTGRPRGFYRKLKVSRIALRELASSGQIPGMVKSSW